MEAVFYGAGAPRNKGFSMNGYLVWYLWVATFSILTLSRAGWSLAIGLTTKGGSISTSPPVNVLVGAAFGITLPLVCACLGIYALITIPAKSLTAPASSFLLLVIAGLAVALAFVVVHEARTWDAFIGARRGAALRRGRRYSEALAVAKRLVKRYPRAGRFWADESVALYGLGHGSEALTAIEQALTLMPRQAQGWAWKASILIALQRDTEALEASERALALAMDAVGVSVCERKGYILVRMGRFAEAVDACERALALEAKNIRRRDGVSQGLALATMATALNGLGRSAEALAAAERAIPFNPYPVRSRLAQSIALERLGRPEEARAAAEQGLAVAERYLVDEPSVIVGAEIWAAKAALLRQLGRAGEADAAEARSQALYAVIRGETRRDAAKVRQ